MIRQIVIILFALLCASCSTRVEYDPPSAVATSKAHLNINTATAEELERLPSIGPKAAESIVQFRTENGPFRRVEHLMLVRGVSERRFAELRPYISIE